MDTATQRLIKNGIRPSVQRVAIMDYLLKHRTHPTVDIIYNALVESIPTLSRTTVYNTLELLKEHKAVLALTIDNRTVHYDGDTSAHAHFQCSRCGRIVDIPLDEAINRPAQLSRKFKIEDVQLNYIGICDKCSESPSAGCN